MLASDLLLDTDLEWIESNIRLVQNMTMFIQRAPAAIFAGTIMKTLFASAAIANRTLMASI